MNTLAPAPPVVAQYSFRQSVLEPEKLYTLCPDRLVVEAPGRPPEIYDLGSVLRVHLKYNRTKQRGYYECHIRFDRWRLFLRHVHWGGPMSFEDRSASYTPFVRALLRQLGNYPHVEMKAGSMLNFIGAIVGVPLFLALGALTISMQRWTSTGLAALLLMLCLVSISRSRPRRFTGDSPPADLLPG